MKRRFTRNRLSKSKNTSAASVPLALDVAIRDGRIREGHRVMLQGVGEGQLSTVSFGEERPAVAGDDESAWSQNRRVEILYAN